MATVKSNSVIVTVQSPTPSCSVSTLTLTVNPTSMYPGGSVSFTAVATDSNGNPVSDASITLVDVTTNTQYGPELTNSLGTADFSVTFPTSMQPGNYYFYAGACEMAVKSNSVVVTVQSSTPSCSVSSLTLSVNPTSVYPGGSVSFTAIAKDSNGNPVSGASITLVESTTNTTFNPVTTNSSGTADFSVTFPSDTQPGSYVFYVEAC